MIKHDRMGIWQSGNATACYAVPTGAWVRTPLSPYSRLTKSKRKKKEEKKEGGLIGNKGSSDSSAGRATV